MPTQEYTIGHTGSVLDPQNEGGIVVLEQNQVNPQRQTPVISFTCPDNFDSISYVAQRDTTKMVLRALETATATDDDGSAALEEGERTFALSADLIPVTGEPKLDEQPYPVVQVVNTTQGTVLDSTQFSVDYAANEVTVDDSAVAIDDSLKFFPVITEGTLKIRGVNSLNQPTGPIYPWGAPLYRWHDMPQDKRGTAINLNGSITWDRNEEMEVMIDSPHQVVWQDPDHPDAYVSTFEQDVEITF